SRDSAPEGAPSQTHEPKLLQPDSRNQTPRLTNSMRSPSQACPPRAPTTVWPRHIKLASGEARHEWIYGCGIRTRTSRSLPSCSAPRETSPPLHEMPNRASEIPFSPDDHSDDSAVRYSSAFAKPSVVPPSFSARRSDSTPPGVTRRSEVEEIRPKDDSVGDSMLSRYFRDMATHQVMGLAEELPAANEVEQAEVDHWVALLSYVPVAARILPELRTHLEGVAEEERPDMKPLERLESLAAGVIGER